MFVVPFYRAGDKVYRLTGQDRTQGCFESWNSGGHLGSAFRSSQQQRSSLIHSFILFFAMDFLHKLLVESWVLWVLGLFVVVCRL